MGKLTTQNSLASKFPELAKEWDYDKNGDASPNDIAFGSHKKVWWKCSRNHEWESAVNARTNSGRARVCARCCGQKVCEDNCLLVKNPELAKEWDYSKNNELTPRTVMPSSDKKAWWVCCRGHSYFANIKNRNLNSAGCPYCGGKKANEENCFATNNPELAKEWDYKRNIGLTPFNVTARSGKKVWWVCNVGHEYSATVNHRSRGKGCPYCSGNRVSDTNCLRTKSPELCCEWNYKRNGLITPDNTSFGSNKKVWWICSNGHEWAARVLARHNGNGCPDCTKILLKDGAKCDSLPEAIKYLEYRLSAETFEHNKKYHASFGRHRYDFYFPLENRYIEVTSYNKDFLGRSPGRYWKYLKNIVKKKHFVEDVLGAKFEFIQFIPTKDQIRTVNEYRKRSAKNKK